MPRKRKRKPRVIPVPVTDDETVYLDDLVNADWPKQTDDSHDAIFARIEAELREQRANEG